MNIIKNYKVMLRGSKYSFPSFLGPIAMNCSGKLARTSPPPHSGRKPEKVLWKMLMWTSLGLFIRGEQAWLA